MTVTGNVRALLERERELATLATMIERVETGSGTLLVIAGPAGIGKSSLMAATSENAAGRGWEVLQARGGELERGVPFGIIAQLLERRLERADPAERKRLLAGPAQHAERALSPAGLQAPGGDGDTLFAIFHGLYWLVMNLAEHRPVLLVIDDAQWADVQSAQWLAYLSRRLQDAPIGVLAASRTPEPDELRSAVASVPDATALRPEPLSRDGAGSVVRAARGEAADPEFCDACHEATGGNPFYLHELVSETSAQGIDPVRSSAELVKSLSTDTIAASVLLRLRQLGPDAVALAEALAVLGIDAEARDAARIARLDPTHVQELADRLAAAGIVREERPLDFAHPVMRTTIYANIAPGRRAALHLAAARALLQAEAGSDQLSRHLMLVDPAGEPWAAEALLRAAQRAFAQGAVATACALAARALAEPPPPHLRAPVLTLLARSEMLSGQAAGMAHLRAALEHEPDPHERTGLMLDLLAVIGSRHHSAVVDGEPLDPRPLLTSVRNALHPDDEAAAAFLDAILLLPLTSTPSPRALALPEIRRRMRMLAERDRTLRGWPDSFLAYEAVRDGLEPAEEAVRLAGRAIAATGPRSDSVAWGTSVDVLIACDRLDAARAAIDAALADARERGSELGFMLASHFQTQLDLALGNLAEATQSARDGLEVAARWSEPNWWVLHLAAGLVISLAHRGELDDARQALVDASELVIATTGRDQDPADRDNQLRYARAHVRAAAGDAAGAAEDLLKLGDEMLAWDIPNPAHWEWRAAAVHALVACGRREEGRELADENLKLARAFKAPGSIGRALHALGQAEDGAARISTLEEAVATLDQTPLRLDQARAQVDLGTALRHAKARSRARDVLRTGLDLAERCGARPLAERAREELRIAGAKPRREALSGTDSLTASELRVARLAAEGMSNREIAQNLFITMRTVAFHLSNVFRKLDLSGREQLKDGLADMHSAPR